MKAAVVGGGSTYTPELVDGLLKRRADLPVTTLTLIDPDERRLANVGRFVTRMCAEVGGAINVETTPDLRAGVRDAAFVFSQFRVGGQAARHADELLGRRWALVGQETTGIGGFAKGLRTIPAALEIQRVVADKALPDAWLINFTNPAGMVTEALLAYGVGGPPRVIGLCNFPWVLRAQLAAALGVAAERIALDYVGLNHLAWVRNVSVSGANRFADALQAWRNSDDVPFSAELVDDLGLILNPYLQYYYATTCILERQRTQRTRAEVVADIETDLLVQYGRDDVVYTPDLLRGRGGASYSAAAAALAADLATTRGGTHVVNVCNNGAVPGLPDNVVVETTCSVARDGATPRPVAPLTEPIRGLVNQVKDYELLTVEAALHGDLRAARLALLTHPLCPDGTRVQAVLDDLLTTNRHLLPRFA